MSTFGASTRKPTRGLASISTLGTSSRLDLIGAALLFLVVAVVSACADGGDRNDSSTALPSAMPGLVSTGTDEPRARDLIDLARRFEGRAGLPMTVDLPQPSIGDVAEFDVLMIALDPDDEPRYRTLSAILEAVSPHAYYYFEDGYDGEPDDLDASVASFEDDIWPAVTGAFGLPPSPGVDGDDRIVILHADLGGAIGGYISDLDTYPRAVLPHSNQRETVYVNLLAVAIGSSDYAFVLAHELQHLSHLELDPDESAWVNEGLSEFAAALVSGRGGAFGAFLDRPDTQLNAWAAIGGSVRHYQASSLFFEYLIEQTGAEVADLASRPENSVEGVVAFLEESGSDRTFAEIVADWAAANFVDASSGPYGYAEIDVSTPTTDDADASGEGTVSQFAADYIQIRAGEFQSGVEFAFDGATDIPVLAAQADANGAFWWSGRGDNIDSMLTRELDLTGVAEATLTFDTWFDIERWFDYAHVAVSEDGGATWETLEGRRTTTDDPLDVAYGPGYTGSTDSWVQERIDLTEYAGTIIQLRFEYITDTALQQPGFAIDNIAVPEIGFLDDAERDVGGWHREGFRLLEEQLEQTFEMRLITLDSPPDVQSIALGDGNRASVELPGLGIEYQSAVIVVVATTEGTTEPASYRYQVTEGTESG